MKNLNAWFRMVLIGLLILPAASIAETVYVSDHFEIPLRTGPGADRKIISLPQSGTALEMLEKGEEWSQVREPNGREGWALNRYLSPSPPSAMLLERVRQDYDVLTAKFKDLQERFNELESQKKSTDADLSQNMKDRNQLNAAYETLKKESSEFLKLKTRHQQMTADLEAEKNLSAKLEEENMQMKRSRIIQWILTGGGIMLVGFFIGLFSSSRRKSRSSLY